MTVIAVKNCIMVADGAAFRDGIIYPLTQNHLKIVRAPDGSLVGSAGDSPALYELREWVRRGMCAEEIPPATEGPFEIDWLHLRTDGTLWRAVSSYRTHPLADVPYAMGAASTAYMVEGAMLAGLSAEQAMRLIMPRSSEIGGPLQVEQL